MEKSFWEQLASLWGRTYYAELLWLFCSLLCCIIAIKTYYQNKKNWLLAYPFISLILIIVTDYLFLSQKNGLGRTAALEFANTLFSVLEVSIFYRYFLPAFSEKKIIIILKTGLIFYYILSFILLTGLFFLVFSQEEIRTYGFRLNLFEMFLLLFISLRYFFEIISKEVTHTIHLHKPPSMWVASALLIYVLVSLPLLLIGNTIFSYNINHYFILFAAHFISISILLICISKALTCKTLQPL